MECHIMYDNMLIKASYMENKDIAHFLINTVAEEWLEIRFIVVIEQLMKLSFCVGV